MCSSVYIRAFDFQRAHGENKIGPEGRKRPKNGVFVVLLDNGSKDLVDFLCVVKSI